MSRQRLTPGQKPLPPGNDNGITSKQVLHQPDDQHPGPSSANISRRNSDESRPTEPVDDPSGADGRRDAKGKRKADASNGSWFSRNVKVRFGSLNLENKGSVARDHLALERTFLAWLRTSLSFASIGIAVTQLFRLNAAIGGSDPASEKGAMTLRQMGKPLGATFLGIAILVLLIGLNRYYESQNWLLKGKFPASRGAIIFLTIISATLIICSLVIILTVSPALSKG